MGSTSPSRLIALFFTFILAIDAAFVIAIGDRKAREAKPGLIVRATDTASAYCTRLIGMKDVTTTLTVTAPALTLTTKTTAPPCTLTVPLVTSFVTSTSNSLLPGNTTSIIVTVARTTTTLATTSYYTPTTTTTSFITITVPASNTAIAVAYVRKRQASTTISTTVTTVPLSTPTGTCSVAGVPSQFQSGLCVVLSSSCSALIQPATTTRSTTTKSTVWVTTTISSKCATTTLSKITSTVIVTKTITQPNLTRTRNITMGVATVTSYVSTVTLYPVGVTTTSTITVIGGLQAPSSPSTTSTSAATSATTTTNTCAFVPMATRSVTLASGAVFSVNNDAFYSNYGAGDRIGSTTFGVSETDCLNSCAVSTECKYFIYSPNYWYCELYRDRTGGYCQSPSSDFESGFKVGDGSSAVVGSSTPGAVLTSTTTTTSSTTTTLITTTTTTTTPSSTTTTTPSSTTTTTITSTTTTSILSTSITATATQSTNNKPPYYFGVTEVYSATDVGHGPTPTCTTYESTCNAPAATSTCNSPTIVGTGANQAEYQPFCGEFWQGRQSTNDINNAAYRGYYWAASSFTDCLRMCDDDDTCVAVTFGASLCWQWGNCLLFTEVFARYTQEAIECKIWDSAVVKNSGAVDVQVGYF